MISQDKLKTVLSSVPADPGVYLMKGQEGAIIYIGKASSLKKRVSSYFREKGHDAKTRVLVKNIIDIEFIVTDSEVEALLLESNLIKKHKPKFNIRLKDDKRYPYIAVTLDDEYPRVVYTRKITHGKNRYFGPYTDAAAARNIVAMINSVFKLKTCKKELPLKKNERPCLNFQMKKCSGICTGIITASEYRALVENAVKFLEGDIDPVLKDLQSMMDSLAGSREYEKAATIRDIIFDMHRVFESQKVSLPSATDHDYLGVSIFGSEAVIILFEFRKGVLLGRKISIFENAEYAGPDEILRTFIIEYYERAEVPQKIIVQYLFEDKNIIEQYLSGKSSRKVSLALPAAREDKGIMNMIARNIDVIHADRMAQQDYTAREQGLEELKRVLSLPALPSTIECFDISNFHGTDAVASMVRFSEGLPDKSEYRRYKIRGHDSPNDPAMIHEAVSRRIQYLVNEDLPLPDLIVIDGGKAQLSRAMEAARNFTDQMVIVSLAKKFEEIYRDPAGQPLGLAKDSPALHILQHIRDEAHRFAVTYHRALRDRRTKKSALDDIPGIGAKTKKLLLEHFSSVDEIRKAGVDDLARIPGIGKRTAEIIIEYFMKQE